MDTPELLLLGEPMFDTACVRTEGTRMTDVWHISTEHVAAEPRSHPAAHQQSQASYWVYIGQWATVHRAACSYCRAGAGPGKNRRFRNWASGGPHTVKWLGPFVTRAEAMTASANQADLRYCNRCLP